MNLGAVLMMVDIGDERTVRSVDGVLYMQRLLCALSGWSTAGALRYDTSAISGASSCFIPTR